MQATVDAVWPFLEAAAEGCQSVGVSQSFSVAETIRLIRAWEKVGRGKGVGGGGSGDYIPIAILSPPE